MTSRKSFFGPQNRHFFMKRALSFMEIVIFRQFNCLLWLCPALQTLIIMYANVPKNAVYVNTPTWFYFSNYCKKQPFKQHQILSEIYFEPNTT